MPVDDNKKEINVNVTGSRTGEQYRGKFYTKKWLSLADELAMDNQRRALLGPSPGEVPVRIGNMATILSELSVRLLEPYPPWWTGGGDLKDDEPAQELYRLVMEAAGEAIKSVKKDGEVAKKEIKEQQQKETAELENS